jgi:hypothetical protein
VAIVAILGLYAVPLSYSKGVSQFTLYGNVIDGSSCLPVANAVVSTTFNSNTVNLTNSTGGYLLRIGYGNWTVTVSKTGYTPISFNTPYVATGSYQFNTYLLAPGGVAANCTTTRHATNSTVPPTVTVKSTVATTAPATTTVAATAQKSGMHLSSTELAGVAVIVVIIIIALAYLGIKGGKGKDHAAKKTEGAKEAKSS